MHGEASGFADGFDPGLYLALNPDVRRAFDRGLIASAVEHWRERGRDEMRAGTRPSLLGLPPLEGGAPPAAEAADGLDTRSYLALNPDLAAAFADDDAKARAHWRDFGAVEGRPGFGAAAPWDRAYAGTAPDAVSRPPGCDLFIEADVGAHEEAAIGRRVLAALRSCSCPVSVRGFTSRDGRLVMDGEILRREATYRTALLVGPVGLCRQILAAHRRDRFADQILLAFLSGAPLRPHMPDWLFLASLDAVLVPSADEAALLRAVSPVPVRSVPLPPAAIGDRAAARRQLGLRTDDLVLFAERPGGIRERPSPCVVSKADIGDADAAGALRLDDVLDPWTGASRLLAACDLFVPAERGRSTLRVDAVAAGLLPSSGNDRGPITSAQAGEAIRACLDRSERRPPTAPARCLGATPAVADLGRPSKPPVLSVLVDARTSGPALETFVGGALAQDHALFELCTVLPPQTDRAALLRAHAASADPRLRLLAPDGIAVGTVFGLAQAAKLATGSHLVPVFDGGDVGRLLGALDAIARRLGLPDAPDLLVEAEHDAEIPRPERDAALVLPLRERLEAAASDPVAVSRDALARVGGFASPEMVTPGADAGYALTLALVRAEARTGAVTLPKPRRRRRPDLAPASERALRRHLFLSGRPATVRPGLLPSSFHVRRPQVRPPPWTVLAARSVRVGTEDGLVLLEGADTQDRIETEHVLLLAQSYRPPLGPVLARLAEILADPGIGAACPLVVDRDGTIAEAGLIADPEGVLRSGPEAGWTLEATGPGRSATSVRNVHGSALCLATRRSLLAEHGIRIPPATGGAAFAGGMAALALALARSGSRVVCTPFATLHAEPG